MTDRFSICLPFTLAQECPDSSNWSDPRNFSNDKHDPGGETMCGIIQREYDQFRKGQGLHCQDVRLCTQLEGLDIYKGHYWLPHCGDLTAGLDLQYFDSAVNMGCTEATKILQHCLKVQVDGTWGTETASAVFACSHVNLNPAFTTRRLAVYKMMNGFKYFGTDWTRRTSEIGAAALKMATAAP
jgi:lysozyme family protein